jgi:hypothetical protein
MKTISDSVLFAIQNTCYCPHCKDDRSVGQVYQTLHKGAIVYACKACDTLVKPGKIGA